MSKLEELNYILTILSELKRYPDQNSETLQSIIDILKYRIEIEEKHLKHSNT